MKKLVCLMIALLLVCSSALAEDVHGLPSAYDFEPLFENAAELTGSGHQITSKNLTSFEGEIRCTFSVTLSTNVVMNIYVLNETQETDEIVILGGGGDANESLSFLNAIGEVLYSTGAISDMQDVGDVLELLDFFDNLQDGDENSIEINGIEYGYLVSSALGCMMFYARIPE